jgi:hypothetical protein
VDGDAILGRSSSRNRWTYEADAVADEEEATMRNLSGRD